MYTKLEQDILNDVFDWSELINPDVHLEITPYILSRLFTNLSEKFKKLAMKVDTDVEKFKLYMDYFTQTLLSTAPYEHGFFENDRNLCRIIIIRSIAANNMWLDTHIDKDTYLSIIGSEDHYKYVQQCDIQIKELWLSKIRTVCIKPYVFDETDLHLASSSSYHLLKNFEEVVFSEWSLYTEEQKAYLWCYSLEAIQRDVQQSEILAFLGTSVNRTPTEEHRVLMSKYLDAAELNFFNTITSICDNSAMELYKMLVKIKLLPDTQNTEAIDFEIV